MWTLIINGESAQITEEKAQKITSQQRAQQIKK